MITVTGKEKHKQEAWRMIVHVHKKLCLGLQYLQSGTNRSKLRVIGGQEKAQGLRKENTRNFIIMAFVSQMIQR